MYYAVQLDTVIQQLKLLGAKSCPSDQLAIMKLREIRDLLEECTVTNAEAEEAQEEGSEEH